MTDETTEETTEDTTAETKEETTEETTTETEKTEESPFSTLRASITDDKIRANAERFNSFEDLAKGHLELRQKLSKGGLKPGKDASDDEMKTFRKAWDIPESSDKYDFGIEEGQELSETQQESFDKWGKVFHDNNISSSAAKALIEGFKADMVQEADAGKIIQEEFAEQASKDLKEDWGKDYDKNLSAANRGAVEMFGEDFESAKTMEVDGKFLLDHPTIVRMFAKVGREMSEAGLGDSMSDSEKGDVREEIETAITKRNEAQAAGRNKEAQRWSDKEQALYAKMNGSVDVVGRSGRKS
jgi:hypothetical protein